MKKDKYRNIDFVKEHLNMCGTCLTRDPETGLCQGNFKNVHGINYLGWFRSEDSDGCDIYSPCELADELITFGSSPT